MCHAGVGTRRVLLADHSMVRRHTAGFDLRGVSLRRPPRKTGWPLRKSCITTSASRSTAHHTWLHLTSQHIFPPRTRPPTSSQGGAGRGGLQWPCWWHHPDVRLASHRKHLPVCSAASPSTFWGVIYFIERRACARSKPTEAATNAKTGGAPLEWGIGTAP